MRTSSRRSRHSSQPGDQNIPKAADVTPSALADALSLLEGGIYSKITPADCVAHLLQLPSTENISAATVANNRIVNWVKKSVLRSNDVDARCSVYKFFRQHGGRVPAEEKLLVHGGSRECAAVTGHRGIDIDDKGEFADEKEGQAVAGGAGGSARSR